MKALADLLAVLVAVAMVIVVVGAATKRRKAR